VIQFETSFEKKMSSLETIKPMKEKDGSWRVSGYYLKKQTRSAEQSGREFLFPSKLFQLAAFKP